MRKHGVSVFGQARVSARGGGVQHGAALQVSAQLHPSIRRHATRGISLHYTRAMGIGIF